MSEVQTGFLTMTTIILISIGLTMMGTGLYQKKTVSSCIQETSGPFMVLGLFLLLIPQIGLYGICCRSKRLFNFFYYGMVVVIIIVSGWSIKCFLYNTTFGIPKNPAEDHRTLPQLLGRLVPKERFEEVTSCIIHNHDCNFNASKNSNVWKYCCAQPEGCGDVTMFDKPGEWSWKHQYERNQVPDQCSYEYCLDCKGCQLSILKAIVHQWKYLSMFAYPSLVLSCISLALAWSLKETIHETEDYLGSYS
ncbi:PREDICTED: tetraspanin-17 [Camelina sativa]|uniref:Tetraspanin-17 n=1 Tax=Camelina sativa TaxID=90675 RepID=A0ABM0WIC8_CAMSA|nr:PREDICTED: tetraspanin-17 [Camelina sativa]